VSDLISGAALAGRFTREAAAGLLHELAELHRAGDRRRRCTMTALAVALAVVVAMAARVDSTWWAAISAFVSLQATAPASVNRGILRVAGTVAGAAAAMLASPWLIEDQPALCLVLLVVSTLGVLGFLVSSHGYAWLLGAITLDMVLMGSLDDPLSTPEIAGSRVVEVTIGTLAAILVTVLMAPDARAEPAAPSPGWGDLFGAQWPAARHALRAGIGVMLVPLVWSWLELPGLSQSAVTVAAVMAVPALTDDEHTDERRIAGRSIQRIIGCLSGGLFGVACLALSVENFVPWLLLLMAGVWVAAHVQASQRGIGYIGTQGAVVFICTLVQGGGPPTSIVPGIGRFAGISGGLLILLAVTLLTAPSRPPGEIGVGLRFRR
jgi:uncharacterized membrane protein YccC